MVTLPREFVAIEYPGYFWNIEEQRLYSIKVGGILRPLKSYKPNKYNKLYERFRGINVKYGYRISHQGKQVWVIDKYLENLEYKDSVIPVEAPSK